MNRKTENNRRRERRAAWAAALAAVIMLATVLMIPTVKAAGTEGIDDGLLDVYACSNGGRRWIGTAVPLAPESLLASGLAEIEDGETLEIIDGVSVWVPVETIRDQWGLVTLILLQDDPEPALPSVYHLLNMNTPFVPSEFTVLSPEGEGRRQRIDVLESAETHWQDLTCLLVRLSGEASIGAPAVGGDGAVAGLIVARYAEGPNRYLMLPVTGLVQALADISARASQLTNKGAPEGLKVTTEDNQVTIDWSEAELPQADGASAYLVITDVENLYLTYVRADSENRATQLQLTPGRTYIAGLVASAGPPSALPEQYAVIAMPEAKPLTANHFRPVLTALTEDPVQAAAEGREPRTLDRVTEDQMRNGEAYFYSASRYEVTEQSSQPMLLSLTAPDGSNYRMESGWIYDPSLQEEDVWWMPMTETGLLDFLNRDGYPAGVYQVDLYIGGALADSFRFEMESGN